ncbi:Acg family FMN-binding oxidoreductase [Shimia ponticola]|uniref:Acg family FMN-binding oxidoreductase n=1 Tax=Shimia ponticola TaxID=2582893 RepID=UPI0021044103|nr:twin-arginine translocation pathway signal protein [Shimia ponticola]
MTLSRRKTIALLGGGFITAAVGASAYEITRMPRTASAPWGQAGGYDDPRMRALSWAILAPNPHNMQPWMVDLRTEGEAVLYVDTDRLLPHTDPFSRQITIGLGCFLEVLRMAALADGYEARVDLFPNGSDDAALDQRPVARVRFAATDAAPDPLFAHVPARRSLKEPFDMTRGVEADKLAALEAAVLPGTEIGTSNEEGFVEEFRALTREALRIELVTPRTFKESVDVMRIGARATDRTPDGIDLNGPMIEFARLAGQMTPEKLMDPTTMSFQQGMEAVLANTDSAMAYVWITTATNTREDQIRTGANWVRVNLAATEQGLGLQPLSQPLQEYPEMADLYARTHERLAPTGGTVQMLCRLGYGPDVPASPRWPIDAKVLNA